MRTLLDNVHRKPETQQHKLLSSKLIIQQRQTRVYGNTLLAATTM